MGKDKVVRTFKYRLYPTSAQRTALQKSLDACRWVYNKALEARKNAWEQEQRSVSLYDTHAMLPRWKQEQPFLLDAYSQSLQNACVRVDLAFQAFFRRVKSGEKPGYPRFRSGSRYDSITFPQSGFRLLDNGKLYLSKVGNIKIRMHRSAGEVIKTLTVRRDALDNWWASFSCEVEPKPLLPVSTAVGIDLGLEKFATLSTGKVIENPRFFRENEKELAKVQRRFSVCEKGTPARRRRKRAVQHVHQRIANRRKDFAHKLSRQLVNSFQIIAFEKLDIRNMQNGNFRGMNKSISDAAWNQLVQYTVYKAAEAGRSVVLVNPHNTSKMCSRCGQIVEKTLSERVHKCPCCDLVLDRDYNAALNILALGLQRIGESP